jgi:hypothetical protein
VFSFNYSARLNYCLPFYLIKEIKSRRKYYCFVQAAAQNLFISQPAKLNEEQKTGLK